MTFSLIALTAAACVVCGFLPVSAAEPQFRTYSTPSFSQLSPFPSYDRQKPNDPWPPFLTSINETETYTLKELSLGDQFEYNYDTLTQEITYRRKGYKDLTLLPVTADFSPFVQRRMYINRERSYYNARKESLVKDQKKKAGGLLQFTIPIQSRAFESIFGEGGASLKVSGYRKISFAGRSTWTDKPQTAFNRQSKFPTLQMEQLYRFDIEGNIGSKIAVKVSQDSNNDIPLANRLLLRYTGAEDDVLQSIEAGNTTLNLPSTQFLRYSTRVQGLFGLKATAQLADVSITAIASQEKGTTESIEISAGGAASATNIIKEVNYKRYSFYDLGRLPIVRSRQFGITPPDPGNQDLYPHRGDMDPTNNRFDFYPGEVTATGDTIPGDSIIKVIVYLDDKISDEAERFSRQKGYCYIDPLDTSFSDSSGVEYNTEGYFEEIGASEYSFDPTRYYIQFYNPLGSDDIMGVYMEVKRSDGTIETIGQLPGEGKDLVLKLLKPSTISQANYHVFEYEWKNVYDLRAQNIDVTDLKIKLYKGKLLNSNVANPSDPDNQDGIDYMRFLGFKTNDDGTLRTGTEYIDRNLGLLILPSRHPFDSKIVVNSKTDSLVNIDNPAIDMADLLILRDSVPDIYRSTNLSVVNSSSEYYFAITTSGQGSSQIDLGSTNIIEGSEVVMYNNTRLIRGKDYEIDANFGRLTILDDRYTGLNSNLSIMFETAPFFSLAKKTLLGARMEYNPSRDFRLGTTLLYKSDKSTNRKPKVGEETSKISVWDVDFEYSLNNPLFTKMVDALPLYSTETASKMRLSGELAQSRPNPNVDGEVYIDDFEGSRDSYSLGLRRLTWRHASRPTQLSDSSAVRGKVAWFNPDVDHQVPITEIYTNRDIAQNEQNSTTVFDILYKPVSEYIKYVDDADSVGEVTPIAPEYTWNGFMRNIPQGVTLQLQDVQLLEMRLKGDVGIMHIDLGLISEDINGNGKPDNEDVTIPRVLEDSMDIGLDLLRNSQEKPVYSDYSQSDPAGDDFYLYDNWRINGTEGNGRVSSDGDGYFDPESENAPDTEDPDYNGLKQSNSYFSYRIDLSDSTQFYVEDTKNEYGWKTLRIPLRDPQAVDTIIGAPTWDQIQYARIWFDSAGVEYEANPIYIRIAALDLVSTTWGDSLVIADSLRGGPVKFDVAVINDEINEDYTPPPGVSGYLDQTRDVVEAEQSLLLSYENLNARVMVLSPDSGFVLAADTGLAVRKFFRASNFMGYGRLQAYVHGDEKLIANGDSIMFFFRIGSDKDGYYEYRTLLKPGWDPENYVDMDFATMTGLKARLIDEYQKGDSSLVKIDESGKYLVRVRKNMRDPTLTSVIYFAMGVINLDTTKTATGTVWVDELRLSDVKDDVGMAARFAVSGNMADLLTYNFGYSTQDAYFRGVSNATKGGAADNLGSGNTKTSYSFSGNLNLQNFFPRSLELRMPINFNWSQNVQDPILRSGTDIVVPEEFKKNETSVSITKGFGISESFNRKTKNIIFTGLLNRLKTSFKYNISQGHSPTQPNYFRENYSSTASYDMSFTKPPSIGLFKWTEKIWSPFGLSKTRLYLYPTRWDFSGALSGGFSSTLNQSSVMTKSTKLDLRGNMNITFKVFDNLNGSYNTNTTRDVSDPNTVKLTFNPKEFKLGVEQSYGQNFKIGYSPKLFNFLTHRVDYSSNFTNSTLTRIVGEDSTYYHNASVKTNVGFNVGLDHTKLIGTNKKGRGVRRGAKDKSGTIGFLGYPLKGIRYITDAIKPVKGDYRFGRSLSNPGLESKALLPYRFGLTEDPGVEPLTGVNTGTSRINKSLSNSISAGSGVMLFSGISADVTYGWDRRETFISNPTITINTTWPQIKFNLRSIKGLWYLGKLMNAVSPSSGFTRTKNTTRRTVDNYINKEQVKTSLNPLMSISVNPSRTIRTTARVETSTDESTNFNGATGVITNVVKGSSIGYSFNISYSFTNPSGIKLPIFGRIKFESNMTVSADVAYRKNKKESSTGVDTNGNLKFAVTEDKSSLTIQPKASYSFSSTVKGGLTGRWQDNYDARLKEKRHTREISLWVEMRF